MFLFLRSVSSYLIKFWTDVFCITRTLNVLRNISRHVSLCWGHCPVFELIFVIFLNVLRNLKDFLDILHKWLDITVVITKFKNVLDFPLLWTFVVYFWSILYYLLHIVWNHLKFSFVWIFVYLSFSKCKAIAIVATEVKHTVMGQFTIYICLFVCKLIYNYL